jgi:hypothetical protein
MHSQLLPREDHSLRAAPAVLSWSNRLNAKGCSSWSCSNNRRSQMAQTSHPASKTNERGQWVGMRATGSTSTRGSEVEGKTILVETWLMEVERRVRFLVIENSMTRNAISASTFPGHPRCNSIPSCWVSMLRSVRFYSSLHLLSELAARGNMRQR